MHDRKASMHIEHLDMVNKQGQTNKYKIAVYNIAKDTIWVKLVTDIMYTMGDCNDYRLMIMDKLGLRLYPCLLFFSMGKKSDRCVTWLQAIDLE